MLPTAGVIKATAKKILSQNYISCFVSCVIFSASFAASVIISGVLETVFNIAVAITAFLIITAFVLFPLFLGVVRYINKAIDNVIDYPISVFYYFSDIKLYKKSISFLLEIAIKVITRGIVFYLPFLVVWLLSSEEFYEKLEIVTPIWSPMLSSVAGFLFIIATVGTIFVALKYYLSTYIFVANDDISPIKAINLSVIVSRRTRIDFVFLAFSMILYILASLIFILLIFTLPFLIMVYALHSKCAVIQYNKTIASLKCDNTNV